MQRKLPPLPTKQDTLQKLDDALNEDNKRRQKKKLGRPQCCGRLPCKGRTPTCYKCDLCMDCITGAGCSHNDSTHRFVNAIEDAEREKEEANG